MDEPTCRTCYAQTLSKYDRVRFFDTPITGAAYYCDEHQRAQDDLTSRVDWSKVVVRTPPAGGESDE